jgi:hypothetical protein
MLAAHLAEGPTRVRPMNRLPGPFASAMAALCLVLAVLGAVASVSTAAVHYESESLTAYEQQLSSGQIKAATINRRLRTLRLTLRDGRHVLARYPPHSEPGVVAALKAKGVPVKLLTPTQALKEAKKPVKHKLRYIAAGILVAALLVVGVVLLVNRRRERD